jgi:hypothetical protein
LEVSWGELQLIPNTLDRTQRSGAAVRAACVMMHALESELHLHPRTRALHP